MAGARAEGAAGGGERPPSASPELIDALEPVRVATGTREADATLVRRLAVEGANAEVEARLERRAAAEALFGLMDAGGFDLELEAVDRLNESPVPATQ